LIDLVEPIYAERDLEHDHDYNHDHDHDHDYNHDHDHGLYDEHVWTSPRNAIRIVEALTAKLAELDPDNADYFHRNAAMYIRELDALDAAFAQVVSEGVRTTLIFGDRFPFAYFTEAYGLTAYAAFPGCANETYVSPATVAFLIDKVRDEGIPVVFYIELSNRQIADVIAEATGVTLLELHSAHNITHADYTAGITYLEIMYRNVEQLRKALS
jgi:zinc transport system substrate-binding protein